MVVTKRLGFAPWINTNQNKHY